MESLLENMIGSRHLKLTVLSEWFQYRLLGDLGLGSVAEVFLARWKLFGEDSFWEKFFGFLFRDGWKDHHAISILFKDIENGGIQSIVKSKGKN